MAKVAIIAGSADSLVNFRGTLITAMQADGHEVFAVGPAADIETERWLKLHQVGFTAVSLARTGISPLQDFRTLLQLMSVLRAMRPDIVLGYTIKPVIYGTVAARLSGIRRCAVMITGLGYAFTDGRSSLKRRIVSFAARILYRLALRFSDSIIFQNTDDRELFRKLRIIKSLSKTTIVNGSGVDIDYFAPALRPDGPRFLMIGRLVADKGVAEYLAAARQVKQRLSGVQFQLIGPTDSNPSALDPMLVDHAIADGIVEYGGEVRDVRPAITSCSVFVLPSYREGTPRSVLEAMSMERAIITTDAPGCRETVTDGLNGFLVPVRSVDGLVSAMLKLAMNSDLRASMGEASRQLVLAKFRADEVARAVIVAMRLEPKVGVRAGQESS